MVGRVLLLVLLVGASGCISVAEESAYPRAVLYPTRQQEEEDLEAARKDGLLSDEEVQTARKMLDEKRGLHRVVPLADNP